MNWGELKAFKLDAFVTCINELVRADEVERALWLCDNLPAYYRDNVPAPIAILKNTIQSRIATPRHYIDIDQKQQSIPDYSSFLGTLRFRLLDKDVQRLNDLKLKVHLVDFAPGEYAFPVLLKQNKRDFSYAPLNLTRSLFDIVMQKHDIQNGYPEGLDPVKIFAACEVIEHLWNPQDIRTEMLSGCGFADIIHISTPKYTFDQHCSDWTTRNLLGHLRAYTPKEFIDQVVRMFPEYDFRFYDSYVMHLRGVMKNSNSQITRQLDID